MKKILAIALFAFAAMSTPGVQKSPDLRAVPGEAAAPLASVKCPKTAPVSCRNCDGSFAYCARSYAFCPECPAP